MLVALCFIKLFSCWSFNNNCFYVEYLIVLQLQLCEQNTWFFVFGSFLQFYRSFDYSLLEFIVVVVLDILVVFCLEYWYISSCFVLSLCCNVFRKAVEKSYLKISKKYNSICYWHNVCFYWSTLYVFCGIVYKRLDLGYCFYCCDPSWFVLRFDWLFCVVEFVLLLSFSVSSCVRSNVFPVLVLMSSRNVLELLFFCLLNTIWPIL